MNKFNCYDCSIKPFQSELELAEHILSKDVKSHPHLRMKARQIIEYHKANRADSAVNKA